MRGREGASGVSPLDLTEGWFVSSLPPIHGLDVIGSIAVSKTVRGSSSLSARATGATLTKVPIACAFQDQTAGKDRQHGRFA